jgi:hypothetical protein
MHELISKVPCCSGIFHFLIIIFVIFAGYDSTKAKITYSCVPFVINQYIVLRNVNELYLSGYNICVPALDPHVQFYGNASTLIH